ncbi:MAG: hypothetical protein ACO3GN_07760 [Bacteroidia bacterium]|jgi:rod shape-determining protein MreD
MIDLMRYTAWLAVLMLLQIILLDQMALLGLISPYIYVFALVILPVGLPAWLYMTIAFGYGLTYDAFTANWGYHALACTLLAYIRPAWVRWFLLKSRYDDPGSIRLNSLGWARFLTYATPLIGVHQFSLYFLESLSFTELHWILLRSLAGVFIVLLCSLGLYATLYGSATRQNN